jgi:hypothetical protein
MARGCARDAAPRRSSSLESPFALYAHYAFDEELPLETTLGRRGSPVFAGTLALLLLMPMLAQPLSPLLAGGAGGIYGLPQRRGAAERGGAATRAQLLFFVVGRPRAQQKQLLAAQRQLQMQHESLQQQLHMQVGASQIVSACVSQT